MTTTTAMTPKDHEFRVGTRRIEDGSCRTATILRLLLAAQGAAPVTGRIPKTGVYTVLEWDSATMSYRAIYVGATCNGVERRLAQHVRNRSPLGQLIRAQGRRALAWKVQAQACAPEDVYELEKAEIRRAMPLLNQREG